LLFSAGTYELYLDEIKDILWIDGLVRTKMREWDEYWLDYRHEGVKEYMSRALDLAQEKGCDGVEFDNIDAYAAFVDEEEDEEEEDDDDEEEEEEEEEEREIKWCNALTAEDQKKYNLWLAEQAHERGLAAGLKNCLGLIKDLKNDFEFAINEDCYDYEECDYYKPFLKLNKPVFAAFYTLESDIEDVCDNYEKNMSIILKDPDQELRYDYVRFDPAKHCNGSSITPGNEDPIKTDSVTKTTTTSTTTENGVDGPFTVETKIDTTTIISENNGVITVKIITETTTTKTTSNGAVSSSTTKSETTSIISGGKSTTATLDDAKSSDAIKSESSSVTAITTTNLNTNKYLIDSIITASNGNSTVCPSVNGNNETTMYVCFSVDDLGNMVYNCPITNGRLNSYCFAVNDVLPVTIDSADGEVVDGNRNLNARRNRNNRRKRTNRNKRNNYNGKIIGMKY